MKTIKVTGTGIEITCTTPEEMHLIFFRLHPWEDLEVNGEVYKASATYGYTISYFKAKYFGRA